MCKKGQWHNTIFSLKIAKTQSNVHNEMYLYKICFKMTISEIVNTGFNSS